MSDLQPNSVSIVALQQREDVIHELALWHQAEWRASGRSVPITRRLQRLRSHLHGDGLPNTWVALAGEKLVGSVSLVDYVFQGDRQASAWVANLFVIPTRRRQGLGTRLLTFGESVARHCKLQRLFLFTPNLRDFYQRQGWHVSHQARVQGQWVDVMAKHLVAESAEAEDASRQSNMVGQPKQPPFSNAAAQSAR